MKTINYLTSGPHLKGCGGWRGNRRITASSRACRCSARHQLFISRCRRSFRVSKLGIRDSQQNGFTLIELLIYVTIFATMIGAVVGLAVLTTSQKTISATTADINYQGEAAMTLITQTVRRATGIASPTTANSSGGLILTMSETSVNPTSFGVFNDGTTTRLRISEGNPAVNNNLTNSRVSVSNLTFTNMSLPSTKGSVQIRFTLTYRTNSVRQELQLSKTFYGAATIP